jgi:hypothetical protein
MSTLRLELDFKTDEIISPIARIYVKASFPMEGDPFTYLSKDCASASELDEAVEFLIDELKKIRQMGHGKFAHFNETEST